MAEKKAKAKKPEEIPNTPCQYCGEAKWKNVKAHERKCSKNPNNEVKKKSLSTVQRIDEEKIRIEIREELLKSLSEKEREKIILDPAEMDKIKEVMKFLGGTEGYQFIYKTITGDKIRGSMTHIIDECIKWLKKHRLYIEWNKK